MAAASTRCDRPPARITCTHRQLSSCTQPAELQQLQAHLDKGRQLGGQPGAACDVCTVHECPQYLQRELACLHWVQRVRCRVARALHRHTLSLSSAVVRCCDCSMSPETEAAAGATRTAGPPPHRRGPVCLEWPLAAGESPQAGLPACVTAHAVASHAKRRMV